MKRINKRKALTLLSIGMFTIATSQVFSYYFELPDLAKGSFVGIGIGLLLTSLIFGSFKTARN
ncbi:hypothetical protein KO494_13555 [Lacinutrix sp. C3R15]|uniref:hypothetical protein n=1 Tax=Flavobacteriaceae TaxID=49546 RepID=UPI001C0840AE|nr:MULTISPECIES: hypothetical protein [Flavobacteriaceae]MBU2940568.1 hypothetical protein [Lacinutrix sp. C3R15]MDO6623887.1 hypothetical protein [Oceanihabitans sp. 1_MG-2023]